MKLTLNEEQRWVILNGLYTAASKYEKLADQGREKSGEAGWERIAEQFTRQTKQVEEMAELIEQADQITFE